MKFEEILLRHFSCLSVEFTPYDLMMGAIFTHFSLFVDAPSHGQVSTEKVVDSFENMVQGDFPDL
jgi:hypothetical protein